MYFSIVTISFSKKDIKMDVETESWMDEVQFWAVQGDLSDDQKMEKIALWEEEGELVKQWELENNKIVVSDDRPIDEICWISSEYLMVAMPLILRELFNPENEHPQSRSSPFYLDHVPAIPIGDFFQRWCKFAELEESTTLLYALVLMDRYRVKYNGIMDLHTTHHALISILVIAIKMNEDNHFDNSLFSKIGGISLQLLNKFEVDLCGAMQFDFHVSREQMETYQILVYEYLEPLQNELKINLPVPQPKSPILQSIPFETPKLYSIQKQPEARRKINHFTLQRKNEKMLIFIDPPVEEHANNGELDLFCSERLIFPES